MVRVLLNNKQNYVELTKKLKDVINFCCSLVLYLEKFIYPAEISLLLTDNEEIKKLNFKFRNKDKATDVLSFPVSDSSFFSFSNDWFFLGDIAISTQMAMKQLEEFESCCVEEEIGRLLVHSVLHLLGYDHEKDCFEANLMRKKERILNRIISNKFKFERRF